MLSRLRSAALPAAILLSVFACERPRSPQFLTIETQEEVFNYFTVFGQSQDSIKITPTIPVLEGDLIATENFFWVAAHDKSLNFSDSGGQTYLNKEVICVPSSVLEENKITNEFRPGKQFWIIIDTVPGYYTNLLFKRLEKGNSKLGVSFANFSGDSSSHAAAIEQTLRLTDPGMIVGAGNPTLLQYLAEEKKLEMLFIDNDDKEVFTELPSIPSLKTFIYWGDSITNQLVQKNRQIENLSLLQFNSPDVLANLSNLRSLCLGFCNSVPLDRIATFKNLERLILAGDSLREVHSLNQLKKLRWLLLPTETDQEQFDSVLTAHPTLEMLQIYGGENIQDVTGLTDCRSLKGLSFYGDTMYTKKGLLDLSNLKYLSLPEESFHDSAYIAMMKKNFPNTTIVPNNGICLGSGWILLLIPLTIVFSLLLRSKIA